MIVIPIIKPKTELINIVLQIFNRYVVINPVNSTFHNSPEGFNVISMHEVIDELFGVVNYKMNIFRLSENPYPLNSSVITIASLLQISLRVARS